VSLGLVDAVILGVVEGLTEFLPISSTGHITIAAGLLGLEVDDPSVTAFTAVIQSGAMAAVLIYFAKDIARFVRGFFGGLRSAAGRQTDDWRLALAVLVGSLPIGIVGLVFRDVIKGPVLRSLVTVGVALILWSAVMVYAERRATQRRPEAEVTIRDGLLIGLAQCVALIPGVSRSGATISAGLLLGLDRVERHAHGVLPRHPGARRGRHHRAARPRSTASSRAGRRRHGRVVRRRLRLDRLAAAPGGEPLHRASSCRTASRSASSCSPCWRSTDAVRSPVMTTVVLVRHGLTAMTGTRPRRLDPRPPPRRAGGRAGGGRRRALRPVPFDAVVSSPLDRCLDTAGAVLEGASLELQVDDRLGECRYGDWTGRPLKELAKDPLWKVVQAHPSAVTFPGPRASRCARRRPARSRPSATGTPGSGRTRPGWPARTATSSRRSWRTRWGCTSTSSSASSSTPCSVTVIRYTELRPFVVRGQRHGGGSRPACPPKRKGRRRRASSDASVGGGAGAGAV
jgi:undecaprenyl-diphosphatase UppP